MGYIGNSPDKTVDVVLDTSPQLGGNLDLNSNDITGTGGIPAGNLTGTVANARLDAQLQDVAGLAVTDGGFIVGDGSNFVLETGATVRTSLGLGTAAVLDTGISNTNVPKFTSGVADNDFLRVDGTAIEGRSASEVLSDIGAQASLTFGISNTNAVKIDSSSVADDEFARFTADGLESRSASEVRSDIGLGTAAVLDTGISNTNVPKFTSGVADNDFLRVDGTAIEGRSASEVLSDIGAQASLTFGISNTNAVKIDSASVADDEFARFTANGLESRSASEVRSDIGLGDVATLNTGISTNNVAKFAAGVADNDFLRVDGTVIEGRSASEVLSDIGAAPSAGDSNIVTTGALDSGSITSGFGSIDTGSSTIFTTGKLGHDSTDYIQWTGNTRLDFFVNNANDMRLESDGDLHVEGDVIAFSTTIASDPRLKENVEPVADALSKVEQLTGYTFDYKHGGSSAGVMSTDVAQVLPSAVSQTTLPLKTGDEETEYDVVAYDQLHALLIEAVKELSARVKELENGASK